MNFTSGSYLAILQIILKSKSMMHFFVIDAVLGKLGMQLVF